MDEALRIKAVACIANVAARGAVAIIEQQRRQTDPEMAALLLKLNGQALEATTGNMIHLLRHLYDLSKEECLKIVEEVTAEADRHIDILGDEAFANASATRH